MVFKSREEGAINGISHLKLAQETKANGGGKKESKRNRSNPKNQMTGHFFFRGLDA